MKISKCTLQSAWVLGTEVRADGNEKLNQNKRA